MCNKSMTFDDTKCDLAFSLVHGIGHGEEVEVLLACPWGRPTSGGKETWEHFLAALCLFSSMCWINAPHKTNYCSNWTLTM